MHQVKQFISNAPQSEIQENLRNSWLLMFAAHFVITAMVGLFVPDDILTNSPWAREFSNFMSRIVPQINRIVAIGIAPDVNRFYFSVLWALSPIALLPLVILSFQQPEKIKKIWLTVFHIQLLSLVACIFAVVASQYGWWMTDIKTRQVRSMYGNAFGRAFWGNFMMVHGPVFLFWAMCVWIVGWVSGFIPRNFSKIEREIP